MRILKKKNKEDSQITPDERYRELGSHEQNESKAGDLRKDASDQRIGGRDSQECASEETNEIQGDIPIGRKILNFLKLVYHEIRENISIYLLSILYLCVCVMNKIFAKRTLKKMGNYSFVTSETHNGICLIIFYALYFMFGRRAMSAKERHCNFGVQFFLISMLDACSVIIAFIGLTRTTGNIQSFVMQLSIPINMFFCFLILRYRYHLFNYVGAFIIVVTIAIVEFLLSFETQEENSIVFNLVLIASLIPLSFSNMTREIVFKKYKINILRLNAIVSFFQIFTSCLMLPMYTLPFLKQINLPFSEIGTNIKNGFRCLFLGQNTIVENCGMGMAKMCDDCDGAWKTFIAYSFFNICDNLITSFIIDKFSTMTYTIVSCIQGPAIAIAYYFKFLAGDAVMQPRVLDFVTLFGYLFGSIIYRIGNIILESKAGNIFPCDGEVTPRMVLELLTNYT
ncbi:chloroquine resistance transporter [Plasmodium inui San Antonio 1]|uniref:Chloroquine resistance transporter n=1 Tax=Plasmodium inui San Antonio 1 TaxID=1237626 RepID=W7AMX8_9APIC|nr:chloroquine resistance transporter [Plasmodium inui San Antonio 1]EUD66651.1 chloroquine resistance transporter [Plasmodium inui San Antonio 1]